MDKPNLKALRELHEKATPGPWDNVSDENDMGFGTAVVVCDAYEDERPGICGDFNRNWPLGTYDAALIAAMRNALPLLLSRLASREAVFEAAVEFMDERDSDYPDPKELARMLIGLRAAIAAARALDAATPQGEEG